MYSYQLLEDLLSLFRKYKKYIFIFNGLTFIGVIVYLLLIPKWYIGQATMIITQEQQISALNYLEGFLPGGILPKLETNVDRYFVLAGSRQIIDKLITKFRLDTIYKEKFKERLYKRVRKDIDLKLNTDGSVTISCYYKNDPYKAAELTNYLFEEIRNLSIDISNKQAKDYRIFLEKIYKETVTELNHIEDSLKNFQEEFGVYDVKEQVKQLISIISELEIEKIKIESEKSFIEKFQYLESNKLNELEVKIKAIQSQIEKLEATNEFSNIPLNEVPEIALSYLRLYRDLKLKEKILEFLIPELEHAKLEEKKSTVNIYLLDEAYPQLIKAKPKRLRLLIIFMMMSGMITIISIKIFEYYRGFKLQNK